MDSPRVSIVIATYNRSNVLALTLQTVLRQTVADFEVLVVGDACTDDTEAVVASFADPRLRFINLKENYGEQSGPNNEGARLAKGKYLAWLNHDDFLLPDHLEKALTQMETTDADLVFTLCVRITAESPGVIFNAIPDGSYNPAFFAPASCWVLRRELPEEIQWRHSREMFLIPSQDFLFRAWRKRKKLRMCPHLTVVAVASEKKPGSYARREEDDHKVVFERISDPTRFSIEELTRQLVEPNAQMLKAHPVRSLVSELIKRVWRSAWLAIGIHPGSVHYALATRKKGGALIRLRKYRGLPQK